VSDDLHASFARISAVRGRQTQSRIARSEQLARLVGYFRILLADYLTRTDPITGSRLVDIGIDEHRAHGGGVAVVVAFFDGSKFKISVDNMGRFTQASTPEIFGSVGKIVEVRVPDDFSRADLCYLAPGDTRGPIRLEPIETFLLAMLNKTAQSIEAQADDQLAPVPLPVAPPLASTPLGADGP
jgi:hypothetical protein